MVDPYAPPEHPATPPPTPAAGAVPWKVSRTFPPVCLKCGGEAATTRHVRLGIGAKSTSLGALGGVFGAMIAQQLRHGGPLLLPIVFVAIAVVGAIAYAVHRRTVHVELDLPLCGRHDDEWTEGANLGRRLVAGLVIAAVSVVAGAMFDVAFLLGVGVVGFLGLIVAVFVLRPARRYVSATALVDDVVHLAGVAPEAALALEKAALEKAARKRPKKARAGDEC